MNIDENVVESIVKRVVSQLSTETASAQTCPSGGDWGVFESMNDAVDAAVEAQREYLNRSMHDRACYVQAIRDVVLDQENLEYISRLAVEETGMGGYEYKLIKNRLAAVKTPGIEDLTTDAMSGDDGLTLVEYSPFGVIGSITPTTNPTETIICNSIGMLAAGNAVVFSPHPRAKKVSLHLIQLINKALCKAGAPANLVVTVSAPSIENTNAMMSHPKIRMLVATGGPAIVKTVLSSGKKAIGAGAGNPPVVVDETADIEKAAKDIVDGCSFDNNLPCIAEKEVIAVDSVADYLIFNMKKNGAYEVKDPAVISQLVELVTKEGKSPKTEFVGKSAKYILDKIGITVGDDVKVILMEAKEDHPFVQVELMMPILPLVRVPDVDQAIEMAVRVEHRHDALPQCGEADQDGQAHPDHDFCEKRPLLRRHRRRRRGLYHVYHRRSHRRGPDFGQILCPAPQMRARRRDGRQINGGLGHYARESARPGGTGRCGGCRRRRISHPCEAQGPGGHRHHQRSGV